MWPLSTFVVDGFPTGAGSTDPMPAWLKAEPIVVRAHDMSQRKKVRSVFGFESCPMFPSHLMLGSPHVPIWFRNSAWMHGSGAHGAHNQFDPEPFGEPQHSHPNTSSSHGR